LISAIRRFLSFRLVGGYCIGGWRLCSSQLALAPRSCSSTLCLET
jgi:hypothetical protein